MVDRKILVLGGTGPAGICLLRELVYRNRATLVYARNPSKVPDDLATHELIEVISGELDDIPTLSDVIARSSLIISLLGPKLTDRNITQTLFADYYRMSIFPLMRQHGVRRILAMGTISISLPEEHGTFLRQVVVSAVRVVANPAYRNILNIGDVFNHDAEGLDWTVFRIGAIPGESDKVSWERDREDGEAFVGWIGEKGWTVSQKRAALARWLVDAAEGGADEWIGKMPAVCRKGG